MSKHIDEAIARAGGLSVLAEKLGVTSQALYNWRFRGVPANYCRAFSAATGVSLQVLRPDDWADYWPELDRRARA